ncbi:MAG: DUF2384 domain-containing protein [Bdellovibrionales bacterium]|nr:DUF2384 domain-containing protein [Bdellovibrionales bacterium]
MAKRSQDILRNAHESKHRQSLSRAFFQILEHWKLSNEEKAKMLGWSYATKRHTLDALKRGQKQMDMDDDKLRRMIEVLNIHKNLRILFPHSRSSLYAWVTKKRHRFGDHSALDIMMEEGLLGMIAIRRYLDHVRTM